MKAPDKIYIPKNIAPHLTEEWASHTHGSLDEYIRKDALIELIKEESKFWDDGEMIFRGLIDKLSSL